MLNSMTESLISGATGLQLRNRSIGWPLQRVANKKAANARRNSWPVP